MEGGYGDIGKTPFVFVKNHQHLIQVVVTRVWVKSWEVRAQEGVGVGDLCDHVRRKRALSPNI